MSRTLPALLAALAALSLCAPADAGYYRSGGFVRSSSGRTFYRSGGYVRSTPRTTLSAPRHIHSYRPRNTIRRPYRDLAVRNQFRRLTGYPNGRPGYEVDHIRALCAGGADSISNMQWLSVGAHRAKTRRDIARCRR